MSDLTIYTPLLVEGADVMRGDGDAYRVLEAMPEHEKWTSPPGSIILARSELREGQTRVVIVPQRNGTSVRHIPLQEETTSVEDNVELVGKIAGGIAADVSLQDIDWTEISIVFSFAPDGFCTGHFGYAYDAHGASTPFTVDEWQIEKDAEAYREWLKGVNGEGMSQMLFQFNRDTGRYRLDFAYGDKPQWQVTPDNLDRIVPALRPKLGES